MKEIKAALTRKGLSEAAASMLAVGNSSAIKNLRVRRGTGRNHPIENLIAVARVLDLEFHLSPHQPAATERLVILDGQDFAAIPLLRAQASAGPGVDNDDGGNADMVELLAFRQEWLHRLGVSPRSACLLRVRGDSMSPRLQPGDLALIDQARTTIRSGRVYAINDINGETRIKRIDQPDQGLLILRSDNPDHPAEARRGPDMNRLRIVGEVVWSSHTWPR